MEKKWIIYLFVMLISFSVHAQADPGIFDRISRAVGDYRLDTTRVPDDKTTRAIIQLRKLKGGFNINESIAYKIREDELKKEKPPELLDRLRQSFENGDGKRWLDNAIIHIYREAFTYRELKKLVKFYKTSAGQKLAIDFPLIMMKSLMAAQQIQEQLAAGSKK
jgi:uncharacterized protein